MIVSINDETVEVTERTTVAAPALQNDWSTTGLSCCPIPTATRYWRSGWKTSAARRSWRGGHLICSPRLRTHNSAAAVPTTQTTRATAR